MKNRSRQGRVSMTLAKDCSEILGTSRTARRDHGNLNGIGHAACQFTIEAGSSTVPIHGGQQNFARTLRFRLTCPFQNIATSRPSTSMREDLPVSAIRSALRID